MADDDLPVVQAPKTKVKVRATLKAFGRDWQLIRPNQVVTNAVMTGPDGGVNIEYLNRYLLAHIHADERAEFEAAIMDDDAVDIDYLSDLMEKMTEVLYQDLPTSPS